MPLKPQDGWTLPAECPGCDVFPASAPPISSIERGVNAGCRTATVISVEHDLMPLADAFILTSRSLRSGDSTRGDEVSIADNGTGAGELVKAANEHYELWLRGHFYRDASRTINPAENLSELLRLLEERGDVSVALDSITGGLFALFVLDRREAKLYAAIDRFGCMPLYYRHDVDCVRFSNNQFALRNTDPPDPVAAFEFLKYGHLPLSESLFKSVQRIGAGEQLILSLDSQKHERAIARSYAYPAPQNRIASPEEGAEAVQATLDAYFAKLDSTSYAAGLSGGYDSRLIAAYLAQHDLTLLNFGNPQSLEVTQAQRVADRLGHLLEQFQIPHDAVNAYGADLPTTMTVLDSLEDAHVLVLADRVRHTGAQRFVDGFIGDVILGGSYFYNFGPVLRKAGRNVLLLDRYDGPVQETARYVDDVYHSKRAVDDEALGARTPVALREDLHDKAAALVDSHRAWCHTHEDMVESLRLATRGRSLIAGGPVALSAVAVTACPYIDNAVVDTCLGLSKRIRAGNRMYNALWRRRFPELADIAKCDTGGKPADSDFIYRLKHLHHAVRRRVNAKVKKLTAGRLDWTEEYSSSDGYLAEPRNAEYLHQLAANAEAVLPAPVAGELVDAALNGQASPAVFLRLGSLVAFLSAGQERMRFDGVSPCPPKV